MHSQYSQSRVKSISSQQDTRNPTTNKKVIFYTPVQKQPQNRYYTQNKTQSNNISTDNKKPKNNTRTLHNSMYSLFLSPNRNQLKARKQQCIRSSRYNQAKQLNKTIQYVQRKRAKTQIKRLVSEHKIEKKVIKKAHIKQMEKFQQAWQGYFIGLRAKEQMTVINFRKVQQRDIIFVQQQLIEKCKTLKITSGELKSLQKTQKKLQRLQRIDQLMELKKEKKLIKTKLLKQQQEKIYSWAKKQEEFLKTYHTKKYNALINRIEELHNDKYRHYQKQGQRLRMKYHNVMRKLDHQQKMQLNQLLDKYPYAKDFSKGRSFTVSV